MKTSEKSCRGPCYILDATLNFTKLFHVAVVANSKPPTYYRIFLQDLVLVWDNKHKMKVSNCGITFNFLNCIKSTVHETLTI